MQVKSLNWALVGLSGSNGNGQKEDKTKATAVALCLISSSRRDQAFSLLLQIGAIVAYYSPVIPPFESHRLLKMNYEEKSPLLYEYEDGDSRFWNIFGICPSDGKFRDLLFEYTKVIFARPANRWLASVLLEKGNLIVFSAKVLLKPGWLVVGDSRPNGEKDDLSSK